MYLPCQSLYQLTPYTVLPQVIVSSCSRADTQIEARCVSNLCNKILFSERRFYNRPFFFQSSLLHHKIPMSSEWTAISTEQLVILESLWDKGMTSKGKKCKILILEAVSKSGLNENVVKDWIGNTSRKKNNRHYTCQKGYYCKGVSGYNLFVKKTKINFQAFLTGQQDGNCYHKKKKTVILMRHVRYLKELFLRNPRKLDTCCLKSWLIFMVYVDYAFSAWITLFYHLDYAISSSRVGMYALACLGCIGTEQIELGAGQALQFFKERPHIQLELLSYCSEDNDNKIDVKELRGQVQVHLNNLYSKAAGKHQKFPYKKVAAGQIRIEGLPENVLPLQLPSHYGERRLKAFLK